jgi:hypothetical protein
MKKVSPEVRSFYSAYIKKRLRPETALEVASGFVLDLVNAFGESLPPGQTPKENWVSVRPERFLLELNALLARFKEAGGKIPGYGALSDIEKSLCSDNSLLLGSLVEYALHNSDPPQPEEEQFQIPATVAADLETLAKES